MTLIWKCPHCKTQWHGTNRFRINRHKIQCWPEDSPFWTHEDEREEIVEYEKEWGLM